jgi:hypothetical protein
MSLPIGFAMQPDTGRSGTEEEESDYRKVGRNEVLPNFVRCRKDETRVEHAEQDITQCAGDTDISIVRDGDEYLIIGSNAHADEDSLEIEREPAMRHAVVQDERYDAYPGGL